MFVPRHRGNNTFLTFVFFLYHCVETAMGVKVNAQTVGENEYVNAIYA